MEPRGAGGALSPLSFILSSKAEHRNVLSMWRFLRLCFEYQVLSYLCSLGETQRLCLPSLFEKKVRGFFSWPAFSHRDGDAYHRDDDENWGESFGRVDGVEALRYPGVRLELQLAVGLAVVGLVAARALARHALRQLDSCPSARLAPPPGGGHRLAAAAAASFSKDAASAASKGGAGAGVGGGGVWLALERWSVSTVANVTWHAAGRARDALRRGWMDAEAEVTQARSSSSLLRSPAHIFSLSLSLSLSRSLVTNPRAFRMC